MRSTLERKSVKQKSVKTTVVIQTQRSKYTNHKAHETISKTRHKALKLGEKNWKISWILSMCSRYVKQVATSNTFKKEIIGEVLSKNYLLSSGLQMKYQNFCKELFKNGASMSGLIKIVLKL